MGEKAVDIHESMNLVLNDEPVELAITVPGVRLFVIVKYRMFAAGLTLDSTARFC
jgi:hypothetical protein